jgi:hypothetical protein
LGLRGFLWVVVILRLPSVGVMDAFGDDEERGFCEWEHESVDSGPGCDVADDDVFASSHAMESGVGTILDDLKRIATKVDAACCEIMDGGCHKSGAFVTSEEKLQALAEALAAFPSCLDWDRLVDFKSYLCGCVDEVYSMDGYGAVQREEGRPRDVVAANLVFFAFKFGGKGDPESIAQAAWEQSGGAVRVYRTSQQRLQQKREALALAAVAAVDGGSGRFAPGGAAHPTIINEQLGNPLASKTTFSNKGKTVTVVPAGVASSISVIVGDAMGVGGGKDGMAGSTSNSRKKTRRRALRALEAKEDAWDAATMEIVRAEMALSEAKALDRASVGKAVAVQAGGSTDVAADGGGSLSSSLRVDSELGGLAGAAPGVVAVAARVVPLLAVAMGSSGRGVTGGGRG